MRNVTLETILILHVSAVGFMTLCAFQELPVDLVTGVAVKFGMRTWLELHVFNGPLMTGGAGRFHVLCLGKVNLHWCMRIVTPGTVCSSKVPVFLWVMAFLTLGNYSLLVRGMLFMTLNTLEIFQMGCTTLLECGYYVIMTGCTPVCSGLVGPDINRWFVRTVTCKTVVNGKIVCMFLMAVCTLVISAVSQPVAGMAVVAVLPGVSAGKFLHINSRLRMTCYAARLDIFKMGEIGYYRGMRVMASFAVI